MATAKTTTTEETKTTKTANTAKPQTRTAKPATKEAAGEQTVPRNGLEPLTLERLKEIRELSLSEAFTLAQSQMPNPKMSGRSGAYKKNGEDMPYSTLEDYLNVIRPACNSWGISFTQPTTSERLEGQAVEYVITVIEKGEERRELARVELPRYQDEKQRGRHLTYFRRQSAGSACGLAGELDNSEDIPSSEVVIGNYYHNDTPKIDKEEARREEELIIEDKLAEMEERRTIAKSMGLTAEGYKSWFKQNVSKPESQMTIEDIDKTLSFLNQNIADFTTIQEMKREAEAAQSGTYDEDVPF